MVRFAVCAYSDCSSHFARNAGTNEEEAFKVIQNAYCTLMHPISHNIQFFDTFYENGGNFIDTANNYQDEEVQLLPAFFFHMCLTDVVAERKTRRRVDEGPRQPRRDGHCDQVYDCLQEHSP